MYVFMFSNMIKFRDEMRVLLLTDIKMSEEELAGKNHVIVEGIISQQSMLQNKTLRELIR